MNHHDTKLATADKQNTAIDDPAYLRSYLPNYTTTKDLAYKSAKMAWLRDHPGATSQQVESAFKGIAQELRL